jgi:putative zinc finger/helix-turn-helix YgiT family protein
VTSSLTCPACGKEDVSTRNETEEFVFRSGGVDYPVTAIYPVHQCSSCGEAFLGEAAETARHAAVCAAMKRLAPAEIIGIRSALNLSRKALADLAGFGEASLARWESGELIQSESNDSLLRLLLVEGNVRALAELRGGSTMSFARRAGRERNVPLMVRGSYSTIVVDYERFRALSKSDADRATRESSRFLIKRTAVVH